MRRHFPTLAAALLVACAAPSHSRAAIGECASPLPQPLGFASAEERFFACNRDLQTAALASAQERVRLQRDFQALTAESAAASARRFDAGEVSRAEANRFRLDAARAANDVAQARAEQNRARFELARLLGAEAFAAAFEVAA